MPAETAQFGQDELAVLINELRGLLKLNVPGDIVELGCYRGETSLHLARELKGYPDKKLFIYDSFEGLPPKAAQDQSPAGTQFKAGELPATKREVVERLKRAGFGDVRVKKAWFSDLTTSDLPKTISLAFLDGDFYESILDSLRLIWPLLSPGAGVLVDDYQNEALPGTQKAVDHWLKYHQVKSFRVEKSLAIIGA